MSLGIYKWFANFWIQVSGNTQTGQSACCVHQLYSARLLKGSTNSMRHFHTFSLPSDHERDCYYMTQWHYKWIGLVVQKGHINNLWNVRSGSLGRWDMIDQISSLKLWLLLSSPYISWKQMTFVVRLCCLWVLAVLVHVSCFCDHADLSALLLLQQYSIRFLTVVLALFSVAQQKYKQPPYFCMAGFFA